MPHAWKTISLSLLRWSSLTTGQPRHDVTLAKREALVVDHLPSGKTPTKNGLNQFTPYVQIIYRRKHGKNMSFYHLQVFFPFFPCFHSSFWRATNIRRPLLPFPPKNRATNGISKNPTWQSITVQNHLGYSPAWQIPNCCKSRIVPWKGLDVAQPQEPRILLQATFFCIQINTHVAHVWSCISLHLENLQSISLNCVMMHYGTIPFIE